MAEQVTDATFESLVLKSDLPVLLDFWAPWCGPCRAVGPIIDELAKEYEGKVRVVKMNVDENPADKIRHPRHSHPGGLQKRRNGGTDHRRRHQGGHEGTA